MTLLNLVFIVLISFLIAKLEIQIEGKDGWAKNLPTWKIKNRITKAFLKDYPITGYHFWAILTMFLILHFPFFLGFSWELVDEIKILATFLLVALVEDFLWFVLNPAFGIRKFNSKFVGWHKWIGPIPLLYLIYGAGATVMIIFAHFSS